jgi:hypothetical protein
MATDNSVRGHFQPRHQTKPAGDRAVPKNVSARNKAETSPAPRDLGAHAADIEDFGAKTQWHTIWIGQSQSPFVCKESIRLKLCDDSIHLKLGSAKP